MAKASRRGPTPDQPEQERVTFDEARAKVVKELVPRLGGHMLMMTDDELDAELSPAREYIRTCRGLLKLERDRLNRLVDTCKALLLRELRRLQQLARLEPQQG